MEGAFLVVLFSPLYANCASGKEEKFEMGKERDGKEEFGWMDGEREVIICQTEPGLMDSDLPCQSFFFAFCLFTSFSL